MNCEDASGRLAGSPASFQHRRPSLVSSASGSAPGVCGGSEGSGRLLLRAAAAWALALVAAGSSSAQQPAESPAKVIQRPIEPQGAFQAGGQVFVRGGFGGFGIDSEEDDRSPAAEQNPAGPQLLEFTDGSTLRGALESLDSARRELGWKRDDASIPLPLNIADVTRLVFDGEPGAEASLPATVKLTGGNWLAADVLGMQSGKVQMKLQNGCVFAVDRAYLEWIYFSKTGAPECYDGPTSLSGWVSAGGWTYRDGALRAATPTPVGRLFESLPDRVEYLVDINQDPRTGGAFAITLHGRNPAAQFQGPGVTQLMFLGNNLQMTAEMDGSMHVQHAPLDAPNHDPSPVPVPSGLNPVGKEPAKNVRIKILEDRLAGRIVVFVNEHKIADWPQSKTKAGGNKGSFSFQPLGWTSNDEQTISRVQVLPWVGPAPGDERSRSAVPTSDFATLTGGETLSGSIESISTRRVKLRTSASTMDLPREKIVFLRFKPPAEPPDEDPPTAFARLAQRGDFEITGAAFRDGIFVLQTAFAGELKLPSSVLREIRFAHEQRATAAAGDELVFRNGDRLRGKLAALDEGSALRWRLTGSGAEVEFASARMAGVLLADRPNPERNGTPATTVQFRNGDMLAGEGLKLDADRLALTNSAAGEMSVPRKEVQTIFFPGGGKPAVFDGASDPDAVVGAPVNGADSVYARIPVRDRNRRGKLGIPNPWHYFDGAFTLSPGTFRAATLNVAPEFDTMPETLEFAFHAASAKGPVIFSAQLFSSEAGAGYLFQLHGQGVFVYDMTARRRVGGVAQQQIQFTGKIRENASDRRVRLFVDRPSGKLTTMIDGVVLGHFVSKGAAGPRNLGHNVVLMTQPGAPCTFSNLWLGPWNGQPPDVLASDDLAGNPKTGDLVSLTNGDETRGALQTIDADTVSLDSDIGGIDLPAARVQTVTLGQRLPPTPVSTGARLRFTGYGVLTVSKCRLVDGEITCHSELAGDLRLPLGSVRELVFPEKEVAGVGR